RQRERHPVVADGRGDAVPRTGGEIPLRAVEIVQGQAELLEVVLAADAGGRLSDLLHRGQQDAQQDGDDGDHHQQLDQRETLAVERGTLHRKLLSGQEKSILEGTRRRRGTRLTSSSNRTGPARFPRGRPWPAATTSRCGRSGPAGGSCFRTRRPT